MHFIFRSNGSTAVSLSLSLSLSGREGEGKSCFGHSGHSGNPEGDKKPIEDYDVNLHAR